MSNDVGTVGISDHAQVNVSFTYTVLDISPPPQVLHSYNLTAAIH